MSELTAEAVQRLGRARYSALRVGVRARAGEPFTAEIHHDQASPARPYAVHPARVVVARDYADSITTCSSGRVATVETKAGLRPESTATKCLLKLERTHYDD